MLFRSGIDLGTTNSLVAIVDSGIPFVIADAEGQRLTPSVVHFPAHGAPVVGRQAQRVRALHPAETVYSIKRFMGRRGADVPRDDLAVAYPVRGEGGGPVTVPLHGRDWTPEEVSAEILRKLRADAEASLAEPVTRAVITVPAYFNDAQRNATIKAGELAGLTVERIVNEPTAAALAYGLDKLRDRSRIAVYDLGGGTFDLSILELNHGTFQVLATHGNTRLGGDDLDRRVTDHLVTEVFSAGGPDLSRATLDPVVASMRARVREAAEQAKIRLSAEDEVEVAIPFLTPTFSFSSRLTRARLEELTRDIVERTRAHCLRAMADAKLEPADLNQVVLVGGQTRMPLVRRLVAEWFGCSEFEEARGEFFRSIGTSFLSLQEEGLLLPVLEADVRYAAPVRYDEWIHVEVVPALEGRIRLAFAYRVLGPAGDVRVTGRTLHVATGLDERPRRMPAPLVEALGPWLA